MYVDPLGLFDLEDDKLSGIITEGDTLSDIVKDYNELTGLDLTIDEVANYNCIQDIDKIYAGDTLYLPVEEWTAVESLKLWGGGARFSDTGMTLRAGTAEVTFGDKYGRRFNASFPVTVTVTEEYGYYAEIFGYNNTNTTYSRLFKLNPSDPFVIDSFEGIFETYGVSKGFLIFGFGGIVGHSTAVDDALKFRDDVWKGNTTGWTVGLGIGMNFISQAIYGEGTRKECECE
jgi:hypothetical protein